MRKMLSGLRLRLSLLYLAASLSLVILLGAATYGLLTIYFQRATDLALQVKMATEFRARGLPLPNALVSAEQAWGQTGSRTPLFSPTTGDSEEEGEDIGNQGAGEEGDERYDGSLAPVFVFPDSGGISLGGQLIVANLAAIVHAQQTGSDLRTVQIDDDKRLRLLTYSLGEGAILQVGRLLTDQDRLLSQYLVGLLITGSIASLLLALASWVLAGRSIKPAQRAWEQQQQFISNASHELRAPLTLLRANADYALRSISATEREQSLKDILGEVDHMNRLVEDLLLLSRLDAHRLTFTEEDVSMEEMLSETTRQVEKLVSAKKVTLVVDSSEGSVRGDRVRLRQVLLILLDNALRFTPPGGAIRISSKLHNREVFLLVADNGEGIPADALPHVFDRFYQVPSQSGDGRGNGLGLSIARGLVEAHHGKIQIDSRVGDGTRVEISLPSS
jgi:signal transduction histidine kinase